MTQVGVAYESPAAYRTGRVPTTLNQRYGTLRLAGDRLSFTHHDGTVRFDVPVAECHSLAKAELGAAFEVWHGATRHRLVMSGTPPAVVVPPVGLGDALLRMDEVAEGIQAQRRMASAARTWTELLEPLVAREAPPGVRVHKPYGNFRYVVTTVFVVLGIAFGLLAVIFAAVWASMG